jgi:hypothetical protein
MPLALRFGTQEALAGVEDYIVEQDTKKAVQDFWDYFFPYASFGCFIGGSIVGFCSLVWG